MVKGAFHTTEINVDFQNIVMTVDVVVEYDYKPFKKGQRDAYGIPEPDVFAEISINSISPNSTNPNEIETALAKWADENIESVSDWIIDDIRGA